MTKYSLLLATLALCGLAAPAWAQPTVNNGDFETGADMFNTFPGYLGGNNPSEIPGWDSHTGGVGVVPGSTTQDPNGAFRDNGDNATNIGFLQGNASLTQFISGFTVGTTYQLDFDYNCRADGGPGGCCSTIPSLTVSFGDLDGSRTWTFNDSFVQAVDPNATHLTPWYHGRFTFRPDQDTVELVISSFTGGLDGTSLIDNLVLSVASP